MATVPRGTPIVSSPSGTSSCNRKFGRGTDGPASKQRTPGVIAVTDAHCLLACVFATVKAGAVMTAQSAGAGKLPLGPL
ncbi:hypothetical protein MRX96_029090 [Rhipicephalus microplus]